MVLKESERLSSDLTELIDFKLRLEEELQSSENRIKVIKARLCEICGSAFGYGEKGQISTLRRKIELAKLKEADEGAMKVRTRSEWQKEFVSTKVLRKVTKKQIHLATPGYSSTEIYDHSGRGSYGIIHPNDLAKILESR